MPLPKAPKKRADILEDYGVEPTVANAPVNKNDIIIAAPIFSADGTGEKTEPTPAPARVKARDTGAEKVKEKTDKKVSAKTTDKATGKAPAKAAEKPVEKASEKPVTHKSKAPVPPKAPTRVKTAKKAAVKAAPETAPTRPIAPTAAPVKAPKHLTTSVKRSQATRGLEGKKLFVLDTNVLMHNPLSLFSFAEHDLFLPMTVLEEIDNHKKGTTDVARNARSVSRTLDAMMEKRNAPLGEGIALNLLGNTEATGRLFIETQTLEAPLPESLPALKADNRILATAKGAVKVFPKHTVVLVSKDINMRIKAQVLGLWAEDYLSDKVLDDTDLVYSGKLALPADFWQRIDGSLESRREDGATFYSFDTATPEKYVLNACLTIDGDPDFMATVTSVEGSRVEIRLMKDYRNSLSVWGINARNAEQNMALNLLMDPTIDFVTLLGQAGTGKTLMTLASALTQTVDTKRFSEIILTRATVSLGDDIGYLPGTEEEKMAPWMGALEDNLEVLQPGENTGAGEWGRQASLDLIRNKIRVKSMSFMRGRTFLKKFVIIDEAQNLSPKQMKALITRAGPGTKIVCMGNIAQIDTPYLTEGSSGLTYVVERFQGWKHAATVTLTRGERSRLADYATDVL